MHVTTNGRRYAFRVDAAEGLQSVDVYDAVRGRLQLLAASAGTELVIDAAPGELQQIADAIYEKLQHDAQD